MRTGEVSPQEMTCVSCASAKPVSGGRLPRSWKRNAQEQPVCADCWQAKYLLRALTFPVAEPLSGSWKELEAELRVLWAETTAAANWMMTECYARDVRRESGQDKMPPMQRVYLYPEARVKFPGLPSQSVASLEQAVQRKYRAMRFKVVWTCAASLPTMRYPQPLPCSNQSWSFLFDQGNRPVISVRLGEKRWQLRLRGGIRYSRQLAGLRRMASRGEAAIYKAHDGVILCKLVGWLERPSMAAEGKTGVLRVHTASDNLLAAVDEKDNRLWIENGDHLRRWISQHRRALQRWAEDQKAEQRPIPSFAERRSAAVQKQNRRMNSAIQEIAAHLANFAARRKYQEVIYDDTGHGFAGDDFPYFRLRERLAVALDERGIKMQIASGQAKEQPASPLAKGEEK